MITLKKKGVVIIQLCILLGTISHVDSAIVPTNENTAILKTGETEGIAIEEKGILPELSLDQYKLEEMLTKDEGEWNVIRRDIVNREERDSKTLKLRISKREIDQFENIREVIEERDYPIQIAHNLVPRADLDTSILKLIRYAEIKDIEGLSEKEQYEELEVKEIELANKKEFVRWENDDARLVSRELTRLYAEYEGTRYEIDPQISFRAGSVEEGYKLKKQEEQNIRVFEDGVYDCKEIMPVEYYTRADGSEYIKKLASRIEKSHKPMQNKRVGWSNNDAELSSMELLQDYVISGGQELNTGAVRSGAKQGYVRLESTDTDVGHLVFRGGHLEQAKQRIEKYRRPDGSEYTRTIEIPSVQIGIPHPVTYNGSSWTVKSGARFRQGTSYAYKGGFAVLDGNMFTKYQTNGTVIRRPALQAELAAFAETKWIPRYWIKGGSTFRRSRTIPDGSLEVLITCPKNECKPTWAGYDRILPSDISPYVKPAINWEQIFRME